MSRVPDYQLDPPEWFNTSYDDDEDEDGEEPEDPRIDAWEWRDDRGDD